MTLPVPLYAFVIEEKARPTKEGRWFQQLTLRAMSNPNIKANMWNAHPDAGNDPKFPHVGDIIEVPDFRDQLATHNSIIINKFHRITKDQLPESEKTVCDFPKAKPEELKEAFRVLGDKTIWSDVKYYNYVVACLAKLDKNKLRSCPAGMSIHHAYQGGLLVHTAEVLTLCKAIYEATPRKYGFINPDVLYAGAILHDIGKVRTYNISELGIAQTIIEERTTGHIYFGMELAYETGEECGMEHDFVMEVVHCIAAHHGRVEWGSVKEVQSIEAGILSRADYISSRNGMIENKLHENIKSGQPLKDEFVLFNDPYFASIGMKRYVQEEMTSM